MTQRVVVDGANVVGSRPDGWWRDRAGAARRLYDRLVAMADERDVEIVLVLEGAARAGVPEGHGGGPTMGHGGGPTEGHGGGPTVGHGGGPTVGHGGGPTMGHGGGVNVVHAPGSGDDEIVRQAVGADLVVTADRELRQRIAPVPATGPSWVR